MSRRSEYSARLALEPIAGRATPLRRSPKPQPRHIAVTPWQVVRGGAYLVALAAALNWLGVV